MWIYFLISIKAQYLQATLTHNYQRGVCIYCGVDTHSLSLEFFFHLSVILHIMKKYDIF